MTRGEYLWKILYAFGLALILPGIVLLVDGQWWAAAFVLVSLPFWVGMVFSAKENR